jgi:hypothetical protein
VIAALAAALAIAAAESAEAATVSFDGSTISVLAAPGEVNDLRTPIDDDDVTTRGPSIYVFSDPSGTVMTAEAGCLQVSVSSVSCEVLPSVLPELFVDLGDGDDTTNPPDSDTQYRSAAGPFRLTHIFGGPGNDRLGGTNGSDVLNGGKGDDQLDPSFGGDHTAGGSGDDRYGPVTYDHSFSGSVSEFVALGPGRDVMKSTGLRGQPTLVTVDGGPGRDRLQLTSEGRYTVHGGSGEDRINVRDGLDNASTTPGHNTDRVACGRSADAVIVDPREFGIVGCESVRRR